MKKSILFLMSLIAVSSVSYSAPKQSLEQSLNAIESKFNDLLEKEAQKKREFEAHKKVLNNYDTYYKNIAKMIREKEQKIAELEAMLSVMN